MGLGGGGGGGGGGQNLNVVLKVKTSEHISHFIMAIQDFLKLQLEYIQLFKVGRP